MLNQAEKIEAGANQTGRVATRVRPDVCPGAVLAILRARSDVHYYGDDSRFDEKFRSKSRGVNWNYLHHADVMFKLGRIMISKKVQAMMTAEEISFCLDAHRRCLCDGVAGGENAQILVGLGKAVPSPYHLCLLDELKYGRVDELVWVLTNCHRTRTVVRFDSEILFMRRKKARGLPRDEHERWVEENRTDFFDR